ncbi:hypothetical protein DSCW_52800 [Desulfosarcina widdelii]|uniref:Benzylsuccinate synthase beta subunit domain-containing protein n=1 Tax=Desulfosarcina widdelii TaxID=947919 RepID=A0A5K7ZDT4_9BACT|nr:benzylsuccinate synthase beta subunit family protein [Desulfosarcina widdelii]BBO77863.1 hypothetical protein DSCW_52800 [Desulfosarcina widdelii]
MEFPKSPIAMRLEEGTKKPCVKCKWQIANPTDPSRGQCTVSRTNEGAIWQRMINDRYNMTCPKYDEGELSFRDHV